MHRPFLIVLSAPSGTGKTSLVREILKNDQRIVFSISATTRSPRQYEVDGVDYSFITREQFQTMLQAHGFLEHTCGFDHYYGTPRDFIDVSLRQGNDVLLDVDWRGAQALRATGCDQVHIFILPPSMSILRQRLTQRRSESDEKLTQRLNAAHEDIHQWEAYDYVLINDNLSETLNDVMHIVCVERMRRHRQPYLGEKINQILSEKVVCNAENDNS